MSISAVDEIWSTEIGLPDNVDDVFRYKFIVDGDWMYDSAQPVLPNNHGSFDNYIKVSNVFTYIDVEGSRVLSFFFWMNSP